MSKTAASRAGGNKSLDDSKHVLILAHFLHSSEQGSHLTQSSLRVVDKQNPQATEA